MTKEQTPPNPRLLRPIEAFEALQPLTGKIKRLVEKAPCDTDQLALLMAVYWFSVAGRRMGLDPISNARVVADRIVDAAQWFDFSEGWDR